MGLDVSERGFYNLTDANLADGDINSILTDSANRAIQGNVTMQVPTLEPIQLAPPDQG